MWNLPNLLSFLRLPLACLFFQANPFLRAAAIVMAMLTDALDGYLARKYKQTSRFGTYLDPLTDKVFVITALYVFLQEDRLYLWQAAAFLCRDFSVFLFSIYLALTGTIGRYKCEAIYCGKITTAIQLPMLLGLALGISIPFYFYVALVFFGTLALVELYRERLQRQLD